MKYIAVPDRWLTETNGCARILVGSTIHLRKARTPRVKIEVSGGVANVTRCTPGVTVTIQDHDNEKAG